MSVSLKRAYDSPSRNDGHRILVDRLWPRGISKERARIDLWMRDVAPADALRKWYHAHPAEWALFRRRYLKELRAHRETLRPIAEMARTGRVTLVFSSSNTERNNAVVLRQYLRMLGAP
jgi:uncharacterized protein YeaO (DUF488 family)